MNLSEWAKNNGIHYRTAWRWFREGELPVPARQLETGTILALDKDCVGDSFSGRVVVYARVSGHDRKEGLDGQVASCLRFAEGYGLSISERVTEIGSGLNGHRKKLLRILADPCVKTIVVEHRDRLSERFGAEYVEAALEARGGHLLVVDDTELEDDLVQDMVAVLTSFRARLHGRRSAKRRAERLVRGCEKGGVE